MKSSFVRQGLSAIGVCALLATGNTALAQFDSQNVTLLSRMALTEFPSNPSSGNDCWGYTSPSGREYALMGLRAALAVVEITDPSNPVLVREIAHSSSLWGDVKTYRDHCYVSNESGGGVQVISLADVDNGNVSLVRSLTNNGLDSAHNVAVDETSGFLYVIGANTNGGALIAFDLADPSNPVFAGQFSGPYTHDAQIVTYTDGPYAGRQIAFCANGRTAFDIVDVTNKSGMTRVGRIDYPGLNYCHQGWLSEDRNYFFLNDELDEQNGYSNVTLTRVFDVSDITNPTLATTFTSGQPAIDHNLYVNGNFVFEANYRSGLRIFDATDPLDAVQTGWIDTYPENDGIGFDGAWSTYPYFPSGTVIISDVNRGLFVVDVTQARASLTFTYVNGLPELVDPNGGTRLRVDVSSRGSEPRPDTGVLHFNDGNGWASYAMDILSDNSYEAVFPASTCGTTVEFYVSAETIRGQTVYDPAGAPVANYTALSATSLTTIEEDNFQTNRGWTVLNENLADGAWERAIPANGGNRGDPPTDSDGSGFCFVTGNGNNQDVDGGPTHTTSPVFDLSGETSVLLTYDRWFYNDDGDDFFQTWGSNDGGSNWTLMQSVGHDPGWHTVSINITDYLPLTSQMRFRFSASDNPNNSVTEAGLDAFKLIAIECSGGGRYSLDVTGACPGTINVAWSNAPPSVQQGIVFGNNLGSLTIPNGPCQGTVLGISGAVRLVQTIGTGSGSGSVNGQVSSGACGRYLQLIIVSTCETSNPDQIP